MENPNKVSVPYQDEEWFNDSEDARKFLLGHFAARRMSKAALVMVAALAGITALAIAAGQ